MTWRLRVEHRTSYSYDGDVTASYNEARLVPLTDLRQTTLEAAVETTPPSRPQRWWDWWGTQVHAFDLHEPHDRLDVLGRALVEAEPHRPVPDDVPGWDVLRGDGLRDRFVEFLSTTPTTGASPEMRQEAAAAAADGDPRATAEALLRLAHDRLEYGPGVTSVATTAAEAWEARAGVCQDYAHVAAALLRAAGLPARYVSGYLHPAAEPVLDEAAVGESHAWVQVWLGDWWAWDVTNDQPVSERHVVVGRARDYADVAPLKGVVAGAPTSALDVSVEITRLR